MKRQITTLLQYSLTIALATGIMLSANARIFSYNPVASAQIAEQLQTITENHDHAHDEIVDLADAYHGHSHNIVDHDHGVAVLPARGDSYFLARGRLYWSKIKSDMSDRETFDLDRPQRG